MKTVAVAANGDCLADCFLFDPYVPLLSTGCHSATDCPGSHSLRVLVTKRTESTLEPRAAYLGTHSL